MSIAHRLEDEEISDVSLCDLLVAVGERSTARLLDRSYQVDAFQTMCIRSSRRSPTRTNPITR
jgi:hypothetical protein